MYGLSCLLHNIFFNPLAVAVFRRRLLLYGGDNLRCTLLYNASEYNCINKDLTIIQDLQNIELIEPTSIVNPTLILSEGSRIKEANYVNLPDLGRCYYINDYIFDYERIIVHCRVDVLMSFQREIYDLKNVILDRTSVAGQYGGDSLANLWLPDNETDVIAFPFIETHDLNAMEGKVFEDEVATFILGITGGVTS